MAEQEQEKEAPEVEVAKLFQLAGYEVTQAVGAEPGTVDWFAVPREGLVRPRTYFRVWKRCPERLEDALDALEFMRVTLRADRALAIVLEGKLPAGYRANFMHEMTGAMTLRLLHLTLANVPEQVREFVQEYGRDVRHAMFLPRRGVVDGKPIVDVVAFIEQWSTSPTSRVLVVASDTFGESAAVLEEARYSVGKRFLDAPDDVMPLMPEEQSQDTPFANLEDTPYKYIVNFGLDVGVSSNEVTFYYDGMSRTDGSTTVQLVAPGSDDVDAWYRKYLPESKLVAEFLDARRRAASFRDLTEHPINLLPFVEALSELDGNDLGGSLAERIVRIVVAYFAAFSGGVFEKINDVFARAALEQFGLGESGALDELWESKDVAGMAPVFSTWTHPEVVPALLPEPLRERLHKYEWAPPRITNLLALHYFLAQKIAREVRAGNLDILARYQFPREYVLLFLAILAPDVAALATEERSEAMRAQIETEVERRLQLTLAHALKRSAGAVRSHIKPIQRHLERTAPGQFDRELARIEEEVAFQSALAEQTRLWHEVPASKVEGLLLEPSLSAVVADLAEDFPQIAYESAVAPDLRVRASREVLREILHCILENAFQAVAFAESLPAPRVRVEARAEGETIRLDILDNGPGVAAGDRERIFDLYVTTKKGGDKKPLGTGMGLPIARRYAEHVGAQVGLDSEREGTCFFVRFVAWRDLG
jgi:signal transduction histidine kinase